MKLHLQIAVLLSILISPFSHAQRINGYVVTEQNILIKGDVRILGDQYGKKISINDGKSYFTRTFYLRELKSYAYKKDTFEILNAFHPFEGEDYLAEGIEAKVVIGKGELKLYSVSFSDYELSYLPNPPPNVGGFVTRINYKTYVIEYSNNFYGVKHDDQKSFVKSISLALADNEPLLKRIRNGELKYKDMKKIIAIYNTSKL